MEVALTCVDVGEGCGEGLEEGGQGTPAYGHAALEDRSQQRADVGGHKAGGGRKQICLHR